MARAKRGKHLVHKESFHSLSRPSSHPPHVPVHTSASQHPQRTHHLLYLITFLLILLVLVVFFSFPYNYTPSAPVEQTNYVLTIDSVSCQWDQDQFSVCETVSWSGPDALFAKGYIPGGESVDHSAPQTTSPFTYCQPVGIEPGYRITRALLYSSTGLVRDIGQGVECLGQKFAAPPDISKPKTTIVTATTGFRTFISEDSSHRNQDIFIKKFQGIVDSCTYTGTWITDNDLFNRRNYCHNAQGTFTGSADAYSQSVVNDPDSFRWSGLSQADLNPPAEQHDGYGFWMELCDDDYYAPGHIPRYGVTGTIQGFGTNTLSFIWDYFDDSNARPAVDFSFDLTCVVRPA